MQPDPVNQEIEAYFAAIPKTRNTRVMALHNLIMQLFPDAQVDLKYRMPTYQYGEGWVAIANQKDYISLYTCGYQHIEGFKQKHPGIRTGKGCINFKDSDRLPIRDIETVVAHAINHPKELPS